MQEEGYFNTPCSQKNILEELIRRNHHIPMTSLPAALGSLVRSKVLRRNKKAPEAGQREVWHWSNWA
jgi:hypothetical protein